MSEETKPSKKFEDNPNFFHRYTDAKEKNKIEKRLKLIQFLGMVEVEPFNFGLPETENHGATSGLYIEMIWNYSDEEFLKYMSFIIATIYGSI